MEFFAPVWTANWLVPNWQRLISTLPLAPIAAFVLKS
jgi:hypothetical protein